MSPQNEMAASLRRDGFGPDEIAAMCTPTASVADAPNPIPLRWGLNDVMWGDDDTVTVLLSGPDGEPYWLELDAEPAAALREDLVGPDAELPDGFKQETCFTAACTACKYSYDEAEVVQHFQRPEDARDWAVASGWTVLTDGRVLCEADDEEHQGLRHTVGVIDPDADPTA